MGPPGTPLLNEEIRSDPVFFSHFHTVNHPSGEAFSAMTNFASYAPPNLPVNFEALLERVLADSPPTLISR